MILDKITNNKQYFPLGKGIEQAFRFLLETDFTSLTAGKYPIDGENLFFLVNEYITKDVADCTMESHRKYIDLQFMYKGKEKIGYSLLMNQEFTKEYDATNDYALYKPEEYSIFNLNENEFAIFYPDDLHMPSIKFNEPEPIKKIVVKILIY